MARPPWIKYFAEDFLSGVETLSASEELAYRRICDLIYKTGGPVILDDAKLSRFTKTGRRWRTIKAELIRRGKLFVTPTGGLMNPKCELTIHDSDAYYLRQRAAGKASADSGKSLQNLKQHPNQPPNTTPNQSTEPKPNQLRRQSQESKFIFNNNLLGRCAPTRAHARVGDAPTREATPHAPPTEQDIAEVEALVRQTTAVLTGHLPRPNGHIADPAAYAAAVKDAKRELWLNTLAAWVASRFDGEARIEAWETIEQARAAGSHNATPPHVRKMLAELNQLYRREKAE